MIIINHANLHSLPCTHYPAKMSGELTTLQKCQVNSLHCKNVRWTHYTAKMSGELTTLQKCQVKQLNYWLQSVYHRNSLIILNVRNYSEYGKIRSDKALYSDIFRVESLSSFSKAHSQSCQTTKMERFAKIANGF